MHVQEAILYTSNHRIRFKNAHWLRKRVAIQALYFGFPILPLLFILIILPASLLFTSISLLVKGFLFSNEVDKWNFIFSGLKRKISLPKIPEDFKRLIELPISHRDAYSYPCKKCLLKLLSQLLSLLFFMNYKYKCNS